MRKMQGHWIIYVYIYVCVSERERKEKGERRRIEREREKVERMEGGKKSKKLGKVLDDFINTYPILYPAKHIQ